MTKILSLAHIRLMSLLDKLNSEQYEAVTTTDGPVLLLAGAGSGKTRVIVYRIAHLIEEKQIRPDRILAVTFTNKAAEEMKNRVKSLIAPERLSPPPQISTFHSLCVRILRRDIDKLVFEGQTKNYTKDFTIYDTDDQLKVIKGCMKDLNIDQKMIAPKVIQSSISSAKSKGLSWENMHSTAVEYGSDLKREATTRVYKMYQERLMTVNALDFDDLLLKTVLLLRNSNETRLRYNERFQYIMIDEYQDTNPPQFALVRLLTEVQQNLCVVGDPDQSIYKFRSADIQNILDFEKHYPRAKTIKLLKNYRSTQNILEAANEVIRNNKQRREKDLHTDNEKGEKLRYYQAFDGDNEASFVADRIKRHLADDPNTRCVILYRTNAQSRLFEEGCRRASLRYNMIGGFSFYERAEIKDIIAYLKFLLNPNDDVALSRIINTPPRGIGKATLEAIQTTATLNKISHWDAIKIIVEEESAGRGANALRSFCKTIER
ncbi:MAG: UvrD-helicase domain-containing protein, partial [Blastocatellia bacterium]|nr:UvrD-helicase domain-containing protein [Blastocatellia bacterium]